MPQAEGQLRIRRALFTASDKSGITELAKTLHQAGAEIIATGKTATVIQEAGVPVTLVEKVSGSPEAFQGRMKTLAFPICSGILARRGDPSDEADMKRLGIQPIDCVVVNFYPFEQAAAKTGISREALIEEVDIGGPTLVRAAAKNAPDVLVLTDPAQYTQVISEVRTQGGVSHSVAHRCAAEAWDLVLRYDRAIARELGTGSRRALRYGENPHQKGFLEVAADSPIDWTHPLTPTELSYSNILDLSAAYELASHLKSLVPESSSVVIVKHNNPCGVMTARSQLAALQGAWEGDPISAFGGVLVFSEPLQKDTAEWLSSKFVELVAAPELKTDSPTLQTLLAKRKNLKAVAIRRFGDFPRELSVAIPGGQLVQTPDLVGDESLKSVTKTQIDPSKNHLYRFGILVCRALKSNAIAIVRERESGFQLVGAGQGQPNRVEALKKLAIPRAQSVLEASGGKIADCVLISDAFFPFRDSIDELHAAGLRTVIQPGGSMKDAEVIAACDEKGVAMAFTGVRHFKH